ASILGFLLNNGDRLLLGGLVDAALLGVYVIAFQIVATLDQFIGRIVGAVTFPALSEVVRERPDALQSSYYRFHNIVGTVAYFGAGVLTISGHALVGVLYDSRYAQAGWMLQILAVSLLSAPFQMSVQVFMALGRPRVLTSIIAIRLVALYLGIT